LPGFTLPESVQATNDVSNALEEAEVVVSVMPSQHCRSLFARMAPHLRSDTLFVSCTKGLEDGTLLRMTEVISDVLRVRKFTPLVRSVVLLFAWREAIQPPSHRLHRQRTGAHRAGRVQRFPSAQKRYVSRAESAAR
jgi:hypothetical protein